MTAYFRGANTGAGQDFTGLAAAVQLRHRVAIGSQALQRCSGFLNRRARGGTVATHHFCIRGEIIIILRFERRVCRWESCRMRQPSLGATARRAKFAALAQPEEASRSGREG